MFSSLAFFISEADSLGRRIGRDHKLPYGLDEQCDLLVVPVEPILNPSFEFLQLPRKLYVGREHLTQPDECANYVDAHFDRPGEY